MKGHKKHFRAYRMSLADIMGIIGYRNLIFRTANYSDGESAVHCTSMEHGSYVAVLIGVKLLWHDVLKVL